MFYVSVCGEKVIIAFDTGGLPAGSSAWALLDSWQAVPLIEGVWVVTSDESALHLRNKLQKFVGGEEGLVIIEVHQGAWWACENPDPRGSEWLRRYIRA